MLTDNEALHLLFAQDIHTQNVAHLIVELECATTRRHDAQGVWLGAIECLLLVLQVAHELDAVVYAIRFEIEEVEAATRLLGAGLAGEIDQLD